MTKHECVEIPIDAIHVADQIRKQFDETAERQMADTILAIGVQQPIRVRPKGDGTFTLMVGERRLRAAVRAGLTSIPAIIESAVLTEAEIVQRQWIENEHRTPLNPIEKATGISTLMKTSGRSSGQAAKMLGTDPSSASKLLAMLTLPEAVQCAVRDGKVPLSLAYEVSVERDPQKRASLCEQLLAGTVAGASGESSDTDAGGASTQKQLIREPLNRDQLRRARRNALATSSIAGRSRVVLQLDAERQLLLIGPGLTTVRTMIDMLEAALPRLRKLKAHTPATVSRMLKEEASSAEAATSPATTAKATG